ncbi:DUF982 domain-containing protein [Mesorhizobium sp. CAU 1732]|uniref:DUF982 domain-containing protein n=1 Tax=Mesorhizobium sp. CAU 1732 TaxID=3140358 RepID=UPI003261AC5D
MTQQDKSFGTPVTVTIGGVPHRIGTVREAVDILSSTQWPGARGPRHRDARDTCLKVLDGHRSTADAEREFAAALDEAGLVVT